MINKMIIDVFTCVTQNNSGYTNFINSFKKYKGWNVITIGKNKKWKGWITRMILYRDTALWISQNKDPKEIIIFLDGYDILCISDSEKFKEKFKEKGYPIIIGGENNCIQYINCRKATKWQSYHEIYNKYPNGGCIIGESYEIYKLFNWCIEKKYTRDDQIALSYYMDNNPLKIMLDMESVFIYNDPYGEEGEYELKERGIKIKNIKENPYFIHFPGLMAKNSVPFWKNNLGKSPKKYELIGKHLLGFEYINEQPINKLVYSITFIVFYIVLFVIIIVMIFYIYFYYNCKHSCLKYSKRN